MIYRNCFFCEFLLIVALVCTSCTAPVSCDKKAVTRFSVMTYNTQAFFDAVENGSEFSEYCGAKSKWSEAMYKDRLNRLVDTIVMCDADMVVMQEIENATVLRDLCNRMPLSAKYDYAAFVTPEKGAAFGSAVLSREPVLSVTAHAVDERDVVLRPLLEVVIDLGSSANSSDSSNSSDSALHLFVAHWKSKSGDSGDGGTKDIRLAQEKMLYSEIERLLAQDKNAFFIACGDFNQKRDEFTLMNKYMNCWDDWISSCDSGEIPGPEGSYYYDTQWETIDNCFLDQSLYDKHGWKLEDFSVVAKPPLVDSSMIPAKFDIYTGKGYSDHLPLVMKFQKVD